jgi:orotidine-5'-phosphate decarboxylase
MSTASPVFFAMDRPDLEGALELGRSLLDAVGGLKVGLEFCTANGPGGVRRVVDLGVPVFLDAKLHDIPNTVAGAMRAACDLGVAMVTLHAAGGPAMLRAAVEATREAGRAPLLLGVTVLTSMDEADLRATGVSGKALDQVLRLADLAVASGLRGLVCSPMEIAPLRQRFGREVKLVVPGIRPAGARPDDQKRTMTPAEVIAAGADFLVVGRPITGAPDPRAAALSIAAEIAAAKAA